MCRTTEGSQRYRDDDMELLLRTPSPMASVEDARRVMDACYPGFANCFPMSGERDTNFRLRSEDGRRSLVLKFINTAESVDETAMQVAVLRHLGQQSDIAVPRHCPAMAHDAGRWRQSTMLLPGPENSDGSFDWVQYRGLAENVARESEIRNSAARKRSTQEDTVRARAYSFLEGKPGFGLGNSLDGAYALGSAAARLDTHLARFDHPAAHRAFLWDTRQVAQLQSMLAGIDASIDCDGLAHFLERFEQRAAHKFSRLPHQVIHNDLSPSNVLVDESGLKLVGVLDFGDMIYAPRIAEVAIAASYLLNGSVDTLDGLHALVEGYESVTELSRTEHESIVDLVLARLAQRIVITSWRANMFPENRAYILRSRTMAAAAFARVYRNWE